jgi:monothiol glutaredoxin
MPFSCIQIALQVHNLNKVDIIPWFLEKQVTNMNVIERIKDQIENNPVVLYMKGSPDFPQCGFSGQTVQILEACQAHYTAINIFEDPELREALKEYSNWPTFPQLYINGNLVGGCDIVTDLYKKGELATLLATATASAQ